jgi:hypothetical protein
VTVYSAGGVTGGGVCWELVVDEELLEVLAGGTVELLVVLDCVVVVVVGVVVDVVVVVLEVPRFMQLTKEGKSKRRVKNKAIRRFIR